jgi:hypothetical protein
MNKKDPVDISHHSIRRRHDKPPVLGKGKEPGKKDRD